MKSKPKTQQRILATVVQVTFALTLILASTAQAGTYVINDCPAAPVPSGNPGPWMVFGSPQNAKGSCSGGTGDYIGPRGATMGPGTIDGVEVSVPSESGITIREAEVWWLVPHQTSGADTFAAARAISGASSFYIGEANTPFGTTAPDHYVLPSTTTGLVFEDYCSADDGGQGCTLGGGESTDLQLFGAQLALADSTLPTASATGGGLTESTTLTGTQTFTYSATDPSSGVRLVKLLVDGNQVATNDYVTQCPYQDFLACPASVSDTITWNTASVGDGQHTLQAIVEDAAHNTRVFYSATITTKNTFTNEAPPPLTSQPATGLGAPNGTNASEAATLRLNGPHAITRAFAHRALTITGQLTDNQGRPITGAVIGVAQRFAGYSTSLPDTTVTTKPGGTFTVQIPPDRHDQSRPPTEPSPATPTTPPAPAFPRPSTQACNSKSPPDTPNQPDPSCCKAKSKDQYPHKAQSLTYSCTTMGTGSPFERPGPIGTATSKNYMNSKAT
jgi:hypothetical protein